MTRHWTGSIVVRCAFALALITPLVTASAQKNVSFPRVTRGAYLQTLTSSSVVIRWRTAQASASVVRFGEESGRLWRTASSAGRSREHIVLVSGLNPKTKYFYSVGSSNWVLQSGPSNFFVTAPTTGSIYPIRVWVLGDPGTASPVQKRVRDAYLNRSGARPTDVILALGDNAYNSGTDRQYEAGFFEVYRDTFKHSAVWPTLGNHDARNADSATESGVYYQVFSLPRRGQAGGTPSGTQAYYSFDYGNTHFVCLNSQDVDLSPGAPAGEAMLRWLRTDLQTNRSTWTVAYWHHPPYSKGSHDSDDPSDKDNRMTEMRETVLPSLEAGGVDLVLCGHSHLYERSYLLHGHYGRSVDFQAAMKQETTDTGGYLKRVNRPGTVYVTAGSAGHATDPRKLHGLNHPAMAVSLNVPGSLVLDILGPRLDAMFLDDQGLRRDSFSIQKTP